jgi:annexin A7/11
LRNAIHGVGTNERVVIQILCSKEAHEIEILRAAYERLFKVSLDKDLKGEEGGPLGRIFRSVAGGNRAHTAVGVDNNLAQKEAQELYDVIIIIIFYKIIYV